MRFVGFLKVQVFGNKQNEQSEEGGGILLGTKSSHNWVWSD